MYLDRGMCWVLATGFSLKVLLTLIVVELGANPLPQFSRLLTLSIGGSIIPIIGADTTQGPSPAITVAYEQFNKLYSQGRYEEALPYAEQALKLGEREFGSDHPSADRLHS